MADLNIGGQAVIEGVMMRSKDKISTAVRTANGEIVVKTEIYHPLSVRYPFLNTPILRGAVAFAEMMVIGIKTLNFSADVAMSDAEKEEANKKGKSVDPSKKQNNLYLAGSAIFALAFGVLIFFFTPLAIASLFGIQKDAVSFNLLAGGIRLTMFVLYVWGISFIKDFHRIFQYHGAEHKSIYTYEMGDELTPERAATYTRFHPRCGTSFILIVALLAILMYAVSDTIFTIAAGHPPALLPRFLLHMSLLPLVAGTSYELLKLSGKTRNNAITKVLIQPGLWLQRITTKEPTPDQLEVAIVALQAALGVVNTRIPSKSIPVS
ncbi:MAG: DUF1385 domain-containing protein [candidate division Zixibacteria bacterium]|nr:DUF1385 domain-containing protein [candidate division Zixibacteria bacterium]